MQREEEKQRELKRQQDLLMVAQQHYNRVLLRRGLALWKRLVQLQQDAAEVSYLIRFVGASAGSRKLRSEPLLKIRRAQKIPKKALKLQGNSKGNPGTRCRYCNKKPRLL